MNNLPGLVAGIKKEMRSTVVKKSVNYNGGDKMTRYDKKTIVASLRSSP